MLPNYGHPPPPPVSFKDEEECMRRMDEGWERREDEGRRILNFVKGIFLFTATRGDTGSLHSAGPNFVKHIQHRAGLSFGPLRHRIYA